GPDVEIQAVLAHAVAAEPVVGAGAGALHAPRAELIGFADARPVLRRLRSFPPQISYGRLSEGNALEAVHTFIRWRTGFQQAIVDLDSIGTVSVCRYAEAESDEDETIGVHRLMMIVPQLIVRGYAWSRGPEGLVESDYFRLTCD